MPNYETFSSDGTSLRSSTAIYRGRYTRSFSALCINVDNNGIDKALDLLQTLSGVKLLSSPPVQTAEIKNSDQPHGSIEDLMKEIISNATSLNPGNRRTDTKKAQIMAVQQMQERGIFLMKGGVEKAADPLGVTRDTIDNYIDKLKSAAS